MVTTTNPISADGDKPVKNKNSRFTKPAKQELLLLKIKKDYALSLNSAINAL